MFCLFSTRNNKVGLDIREYINDDLLIMQARNKKVSTTAIQFAFLQVENWAYKNGMVFDPE